MKKLTKKEAIELMPSVVDNEASEDEKVAFFKYIQDDPEVKKKYESLLFIKQLLKTKYSPKKAPDSLKQKVSDMLEDLEWEEEQESKVDSESSVGKRSDAFGEPDRYKDPDQSSGKFLPLLKPIRYVAAASVIFIFSLLTIEFLDKMSGEQILNRQGLEYVALNHFQTGSHIEASLASFSPKSSDHATELLREEMSYTPRLPKIQGADLRSILKTNFSNGHTVPVFDFYQAGIDEAIHIFAFRLDEFKEPGLAKRDPEAVKVCKTYDDYHIKEINGKHVVSWKWGEYWYTAVSNHNGNDLIALVEAEATVPGDNSSSGW